MKRAYRHLWIIQKMNCVMKSSLKIVWKTKITFLLSETLLLFSKEKCRLFLKTYFLRFLKINCIGIFLPDTKKIYMPRHLPTENKGRKTLLTLLSADTKSAVFLRVPSLTIVEVRNFPLLHFPRWLCLVHGQLAISLQHGKGLVVCKYQCFCLFDTHQWSVLS